MARILQADHDRPWSGAATKGATQPHPRTVQQRTSDREQMLRPIQIQRHPTIEPITMVASTSPSSTEQLAVQQFVQHAPSASARSDAI
ncbi:hypothetical protein ACLOJK_028853 [Asimina triloba]